MLEKYGFRIDGVHRYVFSATEHGLNIMVGTI